jgi:cell division protein FtsZ
LLNSVGKYDIQEAFDFGNEVLYNAVKGITDIISKPGLVNVDFMDVKTVMSDTGNALLGTGIARGEHRAIEATQKAISHPLVEGVSIDGAKNVLINIVAGKLSLTEVDEAIKVITDRTGDDINLIYGVVKDETMGEDFMVTVIATGIDTVSVSPKKTPPMPRRVTPVYEVDDERINYKETETKRPAYLRRGVVIENKGEVSDFDNKKTLEEKPPFLRNVMD